MSSYSLHAWISSIWAELLRLLRLLGLLLRRELWPWLLPLWLLRLLLRHHTPLKDKLELLLLDRCQLIPHMLGVVVLLEP